MSVFDENSIKSLGDLDVIDESGNVVGKSNEFGFRVLDLDQIADQAVLRIAESARIPNYNLVVWDEAPSDDYCAWYEILGEKLAQTDRSDVASFISLLLPSQINKLRHSLRKRARKRRLKRRGHYAGRAK